MAAAPGDKLFELPISNSSDGVATGTVIVTQPARLVYLVTFISPPDNRLTSSFCQTIVLALDILEHRHPAGVVVTTSGIGKFYSNGLDQDHARYTRDFFHDSMYALYRRLLTYPMPTVALLNGHAFAGGLMLAMMHDYRVMNPHRGYLCLNELELGVPLRPPMSSIFRQKVAPQTYRKLILEAKRFKALEALQEGIVDWLGGLNEALMHIDEFQLVQKAQPGVTGRSVCSELKHEMWGETIAYLEDISAASVQETAKLLRWQKERGKREVRVKEWEEGSRKAKL